MRCPVCGAAQCPRVHLHSVIGLVVMLLAVILTGWLASLVYPWEGP
jgi:hypothetical protein